jgi:hypothetical protein
VQSEIMQRYLSLLVGMLLGMLAQWVVMIQVSEDSDDALTFRHQAARVLGGGLASLTAGLFRLDQLGTTPIVNAKFGLWLFQLLAGFGGLTVVEIFYNKTIKQISKKEDTNE